MATELRVPIKLEVLQSSIADIKSTLANLRPESSAWKELQNILRSMIKEADNLQAAMNKPFSAQKDFTSAEKGVGKIEDALERARIIMGRISFSDLKLDANQSAALKEFEHQLQVIQDKAKNFKATLKADLQAGSNWGDILALDPNAITQSYDEIVKSIQTKVKQIEAESRRAAEALRIAEDESNRATASKQFFTAKKSLSREGMGDDWSTFFQNNKNGQLQFRSGQKSAFYEWMRDNLTITPAQYEEIKNKTITELQKWIKEFDINKVINDEAKKTQTKNEATTRVANALADAKKAEIVQQAIANNQEKIAANDRQLQAEKNTVTTNWANYTAAAENAARASLATSSGMQQASTQCSMLSSALQRANTSWISMDRSASTMNGVRNAIVNFMGFHQILNLTRNAVRQAAQHIQELDTVMSKIAIVTDMSTSDLWKQVDAYSDMAQTYGVSIKGAYEVSQIYYQQGLETADVLTLTNETLKLAKISGLDYATTTDYMTTALRGFKMEMSEASTVVDVYSALAANTAVSQEELAVAMSKTASSMESVGSTFEETSAMIGTMVAVTRESATNIGSAMKSIASRYGELTKDPTALLDAEGEAMSFNKVDSALQSVGISMKTVDGQFREFTDVIVELGEKWDQLDSTQQRYIATQFAGNRQQSRFLALVSNVDLLKSNMDVAMNSEDTGTLQALKALDSIESKTEQVKVAYQQFYTTLGAENVWKSALDGLKEYINMLNGLPKLFDKVPIGAIAMVANLVDLIKMAGTSLVSGVAEIWKKTLPENAQVDIAAKNIIPNGQTEAQKAGQDVTAGMSQGMKAGEGEVRAAGVALGEAAIEGLRDGAGTHSPSVPAGETADNIGAGMIIHLDAAVGAVQNAGRSLGEAAIAGVKEGIQNVQAVAALLVSQLATLAPEIQSKFGNLNDFSIDTIRQFIERPEWNNTERAAAYTAIDIQKSTMEATNLVNDINLINQKIAAYEDLKQKQLAVQSITNKESEEYKNARIARNVAAKELGTSWRVNADVRIDNLQAQREQIISEIQNKLSSIIIAIQAKWEDTEQLQSQLTALGFKIPVTPEITTKTSDIQGEINKYQRFLDLRTDINSRKRNDPELENLRSERDALAQELGIKITVPTAEVQAKIEELKSQISDQPVTVPITADTTEAENKEEEFFNKYGHYAREQEINDFEQSRKPLGNTTVPQSQAISTTPVEDQISQYNELQSKLEQIRALEGEIAGGSTDSLGQMQENLRLATDEARQLAEKLQFNITGDAKQDLEAIEQKIKSLKTTSENAASSTAPLRFNQLPTEEVVASEVQQQSAIRETINAAKEKIQELSKSPQGLQQLGSALATVGGVLDKTSEGGRIFAGVITTAGGALKTVGALMQHNAWMALATGIITIINGISIAIEDNAERLERLTKEAEEASNKAKELKSNYNILDKSITKLGELEQKRYDSAEAAEEYQTAVEDLTTKFPALIGGFDEAGNVIFDAVNAEEVLANARKESAQATYEAAEKERESAKESVKQAKESLAKERVATITGDSYDTQSQATQWYSRLSSAWSRLLIPLASENEDVSSIVEKQLDTSHTSLWNMDTTISPQAIFAEYMRLMSENSDNEELVQSLQFLREGLVTNSQGSKEISVPKMLQWLQNQEELTQVQKDFFSLISSDNDKNSLIEEYNQAINTLNSVISSGTEEEISAAYTKAQEIAEKLKKSKLFEEDQDFLTAYESLQSISPDISKLNTLSTNYKGYEKAVISAWQQSAEADQDAWATLSKSSSAALMVTTQIQKDIGDNDYDAYKKEHENEWEEYQQQMALFIGALTEEELLEFNKMANNSSEYTDVDILEKFGSKIPADVIKLITGAYSQSQEFIQARIQSRIAAASNLTTDELDIALPADSFYGKINQLASGRTTKEASILDRIIDQYQNLSNKGYHTDAESYGTAALSLFENIDALQGDIEVSIWKSIYDNGLNTLEGINAIIDSITNNDQLNQGQKDSFIKDLNTLAETNISNMNLSIAAETTNLLDTWEDTEKDLSKAMSSGMSISEMDAFINKAQAIGANISLSDFTASANGMVLTAEAANEYWTKLNTVSDASVTQWNKQIQEASTIIADLSTGGYRRGQLVDSQEKALARIGIDITDDKYWDLNTDTLSDEGFLLLREQLGLTEEAITKYEEYSRIAAEKLRNSYLWDIGDYSTIVNKVTDATDSTKLVQNIEGLRQLASQVDFEKTDYLKKSAKENLNTAYSNLISDVLSKGFDNIDLDDYTGLIEGHVSLENINYTDFIKTYGDFSGKTVNEINALYAQALEKDQEQVASSLIKDFTFTSTDTFMASRDALRNLADAYDIALETLIANAGLKFDEATEQYFGTISGLEFSGVKNIHNIHNFDQIVADSITDYIGSIDVSKFLNATSSTERTQEGNKLAKNIQTYLDATNKAIYKPISEDLQAQLDQIRTNRQDLTRKYMHDEISFAKWDSQWTKLYREEKDILAQVGELSIEEMLDILNNGGQNAVDLLKQLKGENVTTSELETAFNNSSIAKLRTAAGELTKGVGETVTGYTKNIMQAAGFGLAELDDGSAVITSVGDMVQAYTNLYAAMKSNADATTGDLNSAYAKLLTAADQKNIDTLETLENAAGMTYEAFGEILSRYGKSLETTLKYSFVESDGFGKIRITDFDRFASYMNFDVNSPEYAEAYSSWVDSMIGLQDQPRQMMQNMADSIKSLAEAKPGDNINATYIARELGWDDLDLQLVDKLKSYGASFRNGILHLGENADIPGLMAAIANEAAAAGQMIPEQLAEIADAIESMLSNIVSLLGNGLSGNLSNADAQTLSSWASQHGVELNFTKTAEGLRISNEQAYQLYQEISKIDALQGQVAFQSLKENLIATKNEFKTASANIAYIRDLEDQISTLRDKKASPDNEQRIAALEEELALAKQINLERSTSADDSFNFMSNDIPAAQNNPLNYYKNWSEAIKTLNTAMKTSARDSSGKTHKGLIDYTDFYNIVTEMNNLARIGGDIKLGAYTLNGDLESAAKLIEAGAKALTTTDTGDIAVSLGDIGIDFKTGSGDMSKGIQDGIKAMADSQVDMLDGLIQLLETIVAMESLSDIDVDGNGIDLSELFTVTYDKDGNKTTDYTPIYKEWRKDIITKLDDYLEKGEKSEYVDLGKALTGIKIGGISLDQIIRLEPDELLNADKAVQQAYTAVLTAFTKAAQSNNYNLDDIAASVRQELASAGVFDQDLILDIGNSTLVLNGGVMTQINWNTKDNQALLQQVQKDLGLEVGKGEEEARKAVAEAMSKYQSGQELSEQELTWTATVNKHLKVVNGVSTVTWNNKEYTGDDTAAALAAWRLKDAGVDIDRNLTQEEIDTKVIETTTTIGNNENIRVVSNGITIEWYGSDGSGPYTSKDALLKGQYETYVTEQSKVQETSDGADTEILPYEQWVWANYHYHIKTISTTFTADDKAIDLNTNREARDVVRNMYDLGAEQLQEMISQDSEGNYVLTYKGIIVKFDKDTVETDGAADGQKIANELWSQLGLDTGLADTITEGITNAIPKFTEALSSLNTTEPTGLNSWSSAIAAIGTAAETAATAVQTLIDLLASFKGGGSSGPTINVPKGLTVPAEFDTPDTSSVVAMEHELAGGVKVKIPAEFDESTVRSSAAKVLDGANDEMSTDWNTMDVNTQNATGSITEHFTTMTREITAALQQVTQAIDAIKQHVSITWTITVKNPELGETNVEETGGDIREQKPIIKQVTTKTDTTEVSESVAEADATANVNTSTNPNEVVETITALTLPTITVPVQGRYIGTLGLPSKFQALLGAGGATGNFGPADARGTLMGELGPELVVQDGRYFVAGQNGAEFVNLQDDAIVFNHLQTEQLLKKGMSSTRGHAVTNERTAVAFAQGNVNGGPAMASASAALAALKQLRSMWASLASASVQDLAGAGGGGGGGGGDKDMAAYIKELEKWYNWLQKIAELEDKINYQEQLRSTISSSQRKNGSAYYSSLKDTLKNLQEQVKTEQSLIDAQQKYFDKRRKELNTNGPFNSLYTFDENGQLKYKNGALNKLSKLNETDKYGKPKMSSEEQYDYIVNTLGISEQYLQTTASGEKIDKEQDGWQATAVQAFWDKMDADKEEMQSLHDSINEHSEALLAAQEQQNEILQEMRDNQLAVEQNVYDAIVDSRERAIEDAEAMRDALEESTTKFIDGLSSALDKERSMYEMQQSQTDLDQKRRRLAILQRTGGSNSEIASLQSDIASSERDLYFDKQQEQIDLIQEASDKQIEKLDQQIELDRELLEYQKAHGLLWSEVADIMKMDSAAITDFITSNNSEWWAKSPVQSAQDLQDAIFQTDQWVEFRDDQNSFFQNIIDTIYNTTTNAAPDNPTSTADSTTQLDNNENGSNNTRVKYKKLNEKKHKKITQKKNKKGKWETTKEQKEDHDFDSKGKCTKCGYKQKKDSENGTGGSGNSGNGSGSGGAADSSNGAGGDNGDNGGNSGNGNGTLLCVAYCGTKQLASKSHSVKPGFYNYQVYTPSVGKEYKFSSASPQTVQVKAGETATIKYFYTAETSTQTSTGNGGTTNTNKAITEADFLLNDAKQSGKQSVQSLSDINLTQDELQKLRTSTLSNGLSAVNSAMKMNLAAINSSAYTTIDREKSTQIGSISLNMDVKQIANDYDAKRAGEKAMEEMLRIARKSTTATVRR